MSAPVLRIEDLVAGYEPDVPIVRGANIAIASGEIVAILGPNGAGKSTLIKAVAGLVPVFGGRVHLGERDITGWKSHDLIRQGLAFVPQTENVFAGMSVAENLALASAVLPPRAAAGAPRVDVRVLSRPGAAEIAARRPALRRPAADAGGRPRADGGADAADAGRALRRALAQAGGAGVRQAQGDPAIRRDHPPGGAERPRGAGHRRPRLCAGGRAEPPHGHAAPPARATAPSPNSISAASAAAPP